VTRDADRPTPSRHRCAMLRRSAGLRYLRRGAPSACAARNRACRSAAVIALPEGLGPRFIPLITPLRNGII
jgi:hypothetical protein